MKTNMHIMSVEKLNIVLKALLGSEELVNRWWVSPNNHFYRKKPLDVYIDSPEKVTSYVLSQLEAPH